MERMVKFIEHSAELMVQEIEREMNESYYTEKEKLIRIGIMEVNQMYNKKTKLLQRGRAT